MNISIDNNTPFSSINYPIIQSNQTFDLSTNVSPKRVIDQPNENASSHTTSFFTLDNLLMLIYLSVVLFFILRLIIGVGKVFRKIKTSHPAYFHGIQVVYSDSESTASSFLGYIFINPSQFSTNKEIKLTVKHELVHVKEGHSFDLLLLELVKIALWFNPVVYWIKREIEKVHEYLADEITSIKTGKHYYANMLLKHAQSDKKLGLIHSFAFMPIKSRIREIFKARSGKFSITRLVFLLPVLAGLFLIFSCSDDFETNAYLSKDQKIKSIKVKYHDEYGDMPEYDGKYYSWAKFDPSGKLTEVKRGAYKEKERVENIMVVNDLYHPLMKQEDIVWYLDYSYGNYEDFCTIIFKNPKNFARARMDGASRLKEIYDQRELDITKNKNGLPVEIKITNHLTDRHNETKVEVIYIEAYEYNNQGKLMHWGRKTILRPINFKGKIDETYIEREFKYDSKGMLSKIITGDVTYDLFYDNRKNISEIITGNIRYTYEYDNTGKRTKALAYNANGVLEYRLDYEYEYY